MKSEPDFVIVKARLSMKRIEDGGRETGIISGYRPNHVFEYTNGQLINTFVGDIKFDGNTIDPGEQSVVTVRFLRSQPIEKYISIGRRWWIHEGPRVVGEAEILEI